MERIGQGLDWELPSLRSAPCAQGELNASALLSDHLLHLQHEKAVKWMAVWRLPREMVVKTVSRTHVCSCSGDGFSEYATLNVAQLLPRWLHTY